MDPRDDATLRQETLGINEQSAYMNTVKALVQMSYVDFSSIFFGEQFFFRVYKNVRISITRAIVQSILQCRFATYRLYTLVYQIART